MTQEKMAELKLECLKLAGSLGLKTADEIIAAADRFWKAIKSN